MAACFDEDWAWCVACGDKQPDLPCGELSRHECGWCGKSLEVYRSDEGKYQVACSGYHNMRRMNGALVCTLCGYEPDPGP